MRVRITASVATAFSLAAGASCPSQAAEQWHTCVPTQVATYGSRVHIRCATGPDGIVFFAIPTTQSPDQTAFATRAIMIGDAALVSGRLISILYDLDDLSGAAFGCGTNDCRPARSVVIEGR